MVTEPFDPAGYVAGHEMPALPTTAKHLKDLYQVQAKGVAELARHAADLPVGHPLSEAHRYFSDVLTMLARMVSAAGTSPYECKEHQGVRLAFEERVRTLHGRALDLGREFTLQEMTHLMRDFNCGRSALGDTLTRMCRRGMLEHVGYGRYRAIDTGGHRV